MGQIEPCHSLRWHGRSTSVSGPAGPAAGASKSGNNRTNGHAAGTPDSGQYVAGSLKQSCSPAEERQRSLHDADNVLAPRLIPHEHPQWRVDRMVEGGLVQSAYNGFFRVENLCVIPGRDLGFDLWNIWPSESRLVAVGDSRDKRPPERRNPTTLSRLSVEFQRRKAARRSHG